MSLKTISRFGWLTGERTTIQSIGTYGWFYRAGVPVYQISSAYKIPVAIQGEAVYLNTSHLVPVETIIEIITGADIYNIPLSYLSSPSISNTIPIESNAQEFALSTNKSTPIESLTGINLDSLLPVFNLQKISDKNHIPVGVGGQVLLVSTKKNIPLELLKKIAVDSKFPIEAWGLPLLWILDPRSTIWELDERTVQWILESEELRWVLSPRDISWTLLNSCKSWVLEERCNL